MEGGAAGSAGSAGSVRRQWAPVGRRLAVIRLAMCLRLRSALLLPLRRLPLRRLTLLLMPLLRAMLLRLMLLLLLLPLLWPMLLRRWQLLHSRRAVSRSASSLTQLLLLAIRPPQLLLLLALLPITLRGASRIAKRLRRPLRAARVLDRRPLLVPAALLGGAYLALEALAP